MTMPDSQQYIFSGQELIFLTLNIDYLQLKKNSF